MNNGWLTKPFCIEKGVHQGCLLSALLFILVVEVLAKKIKSNIRIKGIAIPSCHEANLNEVEIKNITISR